MSENVRVIDACTVLDYGPDPEGMGWTIRVDRAHWEPGGMVQVVKMPPEPVPHPVSAEHPPEDFDG